VVALFALEFLKSVFYLVSSRNFRAGSAKATEQIYRCGPPTFCLIGLLVALNLMVRFPAQSKIQKRLQSKKRGGRMHNHVGRNGFEISSQPAFGLKAITEF
jgi:hypothetical protein